MRPAETTGFGYASDSTGSVANFAVLTDFFKGHQFKQLEKGTIPDSFKSTDKPTLWAGDATTHLEYATYESPDLVCAVWRIDATETALANQVTSLGCGEKSSYEAAAKAFDPFYAAYTKGKTNLSDEIAFGFKGAGDGADNTKHVTLYQYDPYEWFGYVDGLYYQAAGADTWTYFTDAEGELACSRFDTDVLKKAFTGVNCYDEAAQRTITVH